MMSLKQTIMKPLSFMKFVMMESELFFAKVALVVGAMTLLRARLIKHHWKLSMGLWVRKN